MELDETLKMEKYDSDYLHERLEYKRFLEEILNMYSIIYWKLANQKIDNQFVFVTYRYNEVIPYINAFLKSYKLGEVKKIISSENPNQIVNIVINLKCNNQDLLKAIWCEIQMLDYYNKSIKEAENEYKAFLERDKERYKKLISSNYLDLFFQLSLIDEDNYYADKIPSNVLYRVMNVINENYLFEYPSNVRENFKNYGRALLKIGLAPEMIKTITGLEEQDYTDNPKQR